MKKAVKGLVVLMLAVGLMTGCGQKGPLERPDETDSPVMSGPGDPGTDNR